jgi:hypothetical protein
MNYIDPVKYTKSLKKLNENEDTFEMSKSQMEEPLTMRERISEMSPDNKKKLKEYINAVKEIKKSIEELINGKDSMEEGGNVSKDLYLYTTEEE